MHITKMPGPFGAYADDLDLAEMPAEPELLSLIDALHANGILIIRGQLLTDEQFVRFGHAWGKPLDFMIKSHRRVDHPEMIRITNATSTPSTLRDASAHWHSDSSYDELPASVTMLLGVEVPEQGGETLFANTALAYTGLSEAMKSRIEGLVAVHRLGATEWVNGEIRPDPNRPARDLAAVRHSVVMRHPMTGRPALYLSGTACSIDGMDDHNGRALIRELRAHVVQPQFLQSYKIGVGDILLWDNFQTVHSATPIEYSDAPGKRRLMFRISTKGAPALAPFRTNPS